MVERRDGTSTGLEVTDFSFASDNVERGEDGADFIKRRPTYPIGDDPRGRELGYANATADNPEESYASKNMMFRAYKGQAPLEGQDFGMPRRIGKLDRIKDLRPELPTRSVDFVALERFKEEERRLLEDSGFEVLFPTTEIISPLPGNSFSSGTSIQIHAIGKHQGLQGGLHRAILYVDGLAVDSIVLDRRDQAVAMQQDWFFNYDIPSSKSGNMEITVRSFNMAISNRGIVADDALNFPPRNEDVEGALGTLDGRPGSKTSSAKYQPLLDETHYVRTPGGSSSITVLIT